MMWPKIRNLLRMTHPLKKTRSFRAKLNLLRIPIPRLIETMLLKTTKSSTFNGLVVPVVRALSIMQLRVMEPMAISVRPKKRVPFWVGMRC